MTSMIIFFATVAVLFGLYEVLHRSKKNTSLLAAMGLPVLLTPLWITIHYADFGWFEWGKLSTILLTNGWLVTIRHTQVGSKPIAAKILKLFFGVNILEAVLVDFSNGQLAAVINTVSGLLLIVLLVQSPCQTNRHVIHKELEFRGLTRQWIFAFTLWNLTFLLINYPIILAHHVAVLGVPLLIAIYNPQRWLAARISLLACDLMVFATLSPVLLPIVGTPRIGHYHLELPAALVTLGAGLLTLSFSVSRIASDQASPPRFPSVNHI